jgi:hypothetical protein
MRALFGAVVVIEGEGIEGRRRCRLILARSVLQQRT